MQRPIETDALIIGAGPVGLFQTFQLGLLEISAHIVDALPAAGGQCARLYGDKPIYDIPGLPRTSGQGLVDALLEQVAPLAPTFHFNEQIATLEDQPDGRWRVAGSAGLVFVSKTVFVAAGVGAFMPRKLKLEGIEAFEGSRLFYQPDLDDGLSRFDGQSVAVHGGEEAAVRTALALAGRAARVTLVHRRDVFQAPDDVLDRLREARTDGRIAVAVGQITGLDATDLQLCRPDGASAALPIDALIACLGISPKLGPIADWGLDLQRKQVPVDTEAFATRLPGVFAVGDVNTYPGKKKLIVCGFHEATLAAWAAAAIVFPDKAIPLQYTTTSSRLHTLLGVAGD